MRAGFAMLRSPSPRRSPRRSASTPTRFAKIRDEGLEPLEGHGDLELADRRLRCAAHRLADAQAAGEWAGEVLTGGHLEPQRSRPGAPFGRGWSSERFYAQVTAAPLSDHRRIPARGRRAPRPGDGRRRLSCDRQRADFASVSRQTARQVGDVERARQPSRRTSPRTRRARPTRDCSPRMPAGSTPRQGAAHADATWRAGRAAAQASRRAARAVPRGRRGRLACCCARPRRSAERLRAGPPARAQAGRAAQTCPAIVVAAEHYDRIVAHDRQGAFR